MRGIGGSLKVERRGDRVTLRAVYFSPVFAVIWTVIVAAIVFGTKRSGAMAFDSPIDVIAPAFMFAVGILALFHRTIATSFDMTTKTVLQQRTLFAVWHWRKRSYAFSEIAGIGVDESRDGDGDSEFSVIVTLKDGQVVRLDHKLHDETICAQTAESIRAATALPRVDRSWREEAKAA